MMTEIELDRLANTIVELIESYDASFVEAIYLLDRIKYNFHQSLSQIEDEEESSTEN